MSIGQRIEERLQALGGPAEGFTQSWLAREVGVSQPAINILVRNPEKGTKHLPKIARALRTSPEYLLGETDDPGRGTAIVIQAEEVIDQLGLQMIPEVNISYGLGAGAFLDSDYPDLQMVPFRQDWLRRAIGPGPVDVFLARGLGDSMMPTILDDDDVLVNRAVTAINQQDRIWCVAYGGLGAIKRVRRLPGGMFQLNSDNPAVRPIDLAEDELHVIGRVVWTARRV